MKVNQKVIIAALGVLIATIAVTANAYTGQKLEKNAKVKMTEAREIALKAHPGKITDEELEKEKGGSGLRYSFDITQVGKKGTQEVGVDAMTGVVLENKLEGKNPD
jgi:uncharacterized membrane protein YkoI